MWMELRTDRLILRPLIERDQHNLERTLGDVEVARRDLRAALEHWSRHGFGPLAAVERATGRFVGVLELHYSGEGLTGISPDEVEIGWMIDPSRRREGFASEAARATLAYGLELAEHVVAYIRHGNEASFRIAEKLGMQREREGVARDGDAIAIYVARRATA